MRIQGRSACSTARYEDGVLWVIDYKTSARAISIDQIESNVTQGTEKYRGQIEQYASLLSSLRPDKSIRGAL